jgi:hypothetical protein
MEFWQISISLKDISVQIVHMAGSIFQRRPIKVLVLVFWRVRLMVSSDNEKKAQENDKETKENKQSQSQDNKGEKDESRAKSTSTSDSSGSGNGSGANGIFNGFTKEDWLIVALIFLSIGASVLDDVRTGETEIDWQTFHSKYLATGKVIVGVISN